LKDRRFAFAVIFLIALLDSIAFGIILPVTPDLLMEITGEDISSAAVYGGWLMFVFAIMQFMAMPVLGNLSDAYGRRRVLMISLTVLGINYLIMGLAQSLLLLFIGRLISGVGSATFSTCNAYIADLTDVDERAQFFGMTGAAFGAGFIIGPVIGGFMGDLGTRVPFFATSALAFISLTISLFLLPESLKPENRRSFDIARANPVSALMQFSRFRVVFGIIGVMFIYNLGHHALPAVWSYYGIEKFGWTPREIGYSLGFIGALMVLVQGFLIRAVVPVLGLRKAGLAGLTFMTVGFVGYALAENAWMVAIAMIIASLGALSGPALSGIASGQIGPTQQGELQGALGSVMSLTSIIGPPMMTMVFGVFSGSQAIYYFPGAPYMLAAFLTLLSLMLFARATRGYVEDPATFARR
jgi:DHA1 family tetracycline resistance protein-like MFS transporter